MVVLLLSVALIAEKTLLGRSTGNRELQLIPFYTFTTVSYNNEAIRGLLMNTVLFLPFGLTIPHLLEIKEKNNKARWCMSVLSGLGISILVECLQFVFGIGRAETDDVICNTLGCALGVSADIVATVIITKIKLRKK
ncbi:MAG: VanZ family protein [Lachnospiraceae bacterium]|nr:VanZ family protein [Lachnospiraceae bacterium]